MTRTQTQTDFSGGLIEAVSPGDFSERQVSVLRGLIHESELALRSQWAWQPVGAAGNFTCVRTLRSDTADFLVAVTTAGALMWAHAPARDADAASSRAVSWQPVAGAASNPDYRLTADIPVVSTLGTVAKAGMLVHAPASTTPALLLAEDDSANLVIVHTWASFYPGKTVDSLGNLIPNSEVMPRHSLATMWGSYLVLADCEYAASTGAVISDSNRKRYRNGLWVSSTPLLAETFRPDQFNPVRGFATIGDPEGHIVGLQVVDEGLLVLKTDGLWLLRGTAPGRSADGLSSTFRPELLRAGLGAPEPASVGAQADLAFWPAAGQSCWVEARGSIWTTNASREGTGQLDRNAATIPTTAVAGDQCIAVGQYLVVSRAGRMLSLRLFGQDGAWSELVAPGAMHSLSVLYDAMYAVTGGRVWRMAQGVAAERGLIDGAAVDLELGSATYGDPDEYDSKLWHRVGIRATGNNAAKLVSVTTKAAGCLASGTYPTYTETLNVALTERAEKVVRAGIGPSIEASARWVFQGDVSIEGIFLTAHGKKARRQ